MATSYSGKYYHRAECLGEGAFGTVCTVYDDDGCVWALKSFDSEDSDEGLDIGALREVSVLRMLSQDSVYQHPFIMHLVDVIPMYNQDQGIAIVMPKYTCSLDKLIGTGALCNRAKKRVAHGLLSAVSFLHSNSIIHRDIKPDNILMNDDMQPVLADFSLAKIFNSRCDEATHTPQVGTPTYRAPEVYAQQGYGLVSDCWSCGVVLLEIFSDAIIPAEKDRDALQYVQACRDKMNTNQVSSILKGLLDFDKKQRITCEQALRTDFFMTLQCTQGPGKCVINKATMAGPYSNSKNKKNKISKFRVIWEALQGSNELTIAAAEIYSDRSGCSDEACVILAHKMYEEFLIDLKDACEILDIEPSVYTRTEKEILKAMDYCLFV